MTSFPLFENYQNTALGLVLSLKNALPSDCNILESAPIKASGRVRDKAGVRFNVICRVVRDRKLLGGLQVTLIDKRGTLCRWVRGCVAGEPEVCPWMEM